MRIIHLTDPHLSSLADVQLSRLRGKRLLGYQSWYRNRRHHYQRHALDRVVTAIHADAADVIMVTGDLVHIGLATEFAQARDWLQTLGPTNQVRLVPGNHDCYHAESWALAKSAYGGYLAWAPPETHSEPGEFPGVEHYGELTLIAASSAHPAPWWAATGTLGTDQRHKIARALAAATGAFRVLALHHPPLPDSCSRRKCLTDAQPLQAVLHQGRPQLTLHGHIHRNSAIQTAMGYPQQQHRSYSYQIPAAHGRNTCLRKGILGMASMTLAQSAMVAAPSIKRAKPLPSRALAVRIIIDTPNSGLAIKTALKILSIRTRPGDIGGGTE